MLALRSITAVFAVAVAGVTTAPADARQGWSTVRNGTIKADRLRGGDGPDYLRGHEGPDRITGGPGADLLMGDTGGDRVDGGPGDDTITGAAGGDTLLGQGGADVIVGGFGSDHIEGGPGDDVLDGANDQDVISGGAGDDIIHGGSGQDYVSGGDGNDRLYSDSGAGAVLGGDGDDVIVVEDSDGIKVDCGAGNDTLYIATPPGLSDDFTTRDSSIAKRAPGCERVLLTDDVPDPNQGIKYLAGDAGGAKDGTAKDDILLGGPGVDTLRGLSGNDVLWGLRQAGVTSPAADTLDAGPGDDTVYGGQGPQTISGGPGDDFINGGLGRNAISGGPGDDTIRLRGGDVNTVDAGTGDDMVYAAGPAQARVRCGPGRDVVYASVNDAVARDCETVRSGGAGKPQRLRADPPPTPAPANTYASIVRATPGLVHRWRLDDQQDQNKVDDVTGIAGYGYGRPEEQGATDDGDAAWLSAGSSFVPNVWSGTPRTLPASTLELWVRTGLAPSAREVVTSDRGTDQPTDKGAGYTVMALAGGRFQVILGTQAGETTTLTSAPSDRAVDSWHHLALTRDGTTATLYVDGEPADAGPDRDLTFRLPPGVAYYSPSQWTFGALGYHAFDDPGYGSDGQRRPGGPAPFSGALDEIAVYDRALDAATLKAHARFGDGAPPPTSSLYFPIPTTIGARFDTFIVSERGSTRFRCRIDDGPAELPCRPRLSITLPTGPHTLQIRAVDRYGVTETAPRSYRFTVDATLPRTLAVAKVGRVGDTSSAYAFTSDDPAATFECNVAGRYGISITPAGETADAEGFSPCRSPVVSDPADPITYFRVRAVDATGNKDPSPATIDPALPYGSPAPLPALAATRADVVIAYDYGVGFSTISCRLDGEALGSCPTSFRLPILAAGMHTLTATQTETPASGAPMAAALTWAAPAPVAGSRVELAALQFPAVVESSAQLARRVPRIRFVLGANATVTLAVRDAAGRMVGSVGGPAFAGANALKIPAAALRQLRLGRYTLIVTAQGATGTPSAQAVPFALIPRTR